MSRASSKLSLRGWYVISTRPLGQHGGVRRSAASLGASVFALSTLRLQAMDARQSLPGVLRCPNIIVTSPAAVRFAQSQVALSTARESQWLAVGAGTAAALHRAGIAAVMTPVSRTDSEGLLALPPLQQIAGQHVGLITAPGGRGLLSSELTGRGARVEMAEVYRREPMAISPARLRSLDRLPESSALLLTSEEGFSPLWQALDAESRAALISRPCVVPGERLAALARALGFRRVLSAVNARPPQMLEALGKHVEAACFR